MNRTPEEASLDPWAETMRMQEERAMMVSKADLARKAKRSEILWNTTWTLLTIIAIGAAVAGIIFAVSYFRRDTGQRDLKMEREQTEQVQECTRLPEPVERQFCLLSLGLKEAEEEPA